MQDNDPVARRKQLLKDAQDVAYAKAEGVTKSIISTVILMLFLLAVPLMIGSVIWPRAIDNTDKDRNQRSGLALRTDFGTGCEYLETQQGYLVPRLKADGTHLCTGPAQ